MKLSDREWKDFVVPYVFQKIQRGKRLKNSDHVPGIVPYVSSTANNNGVDDYIEAIDGTRVFENCISLANSGSVGTAFYEPFAFVASDHVTSLKRENASQYIYLFLTVVLEQQGSNFNFNREINDLRIKKMRIMLPVDDNDEPDYQFMEDYMKELVTKKRNQYQTYVEQRLTELGIDAKNIGGGYDLNLDSRNYKPFRLNKLFDVSKGIYLPKWNVISGLNPFITAKAGNNGVSEFIANNTLFSAGTITIEKIKLSAYYQPHDFYCSHDVSTLDIGFKNEFIAQFICTMIMRNNSKYSYGRQAQMNVVKREMILLPVDDNDEPDYQFMEECGRKMMAKKYIQYMTFLGASDTIRTVINNN